MNTLEDVKKIDKCKLLLVLLYHLFRGIKFNIIIKNGIITTGKITEKKVVHDGDAGTYYKLTFTYYSDEQNKNKHKTAVITSNLAPFQNEKKEFIIFNKKRPNQSLVLDNLAISVSKYIKKNWTK